MQYYNIKWYNTLQDNINWILWNTIFIRIILLSSYYDAITLQNETVWYNILQYYAPYCHVISCHAIYYIILHEYNAEQYNIQITTHHMLYYNSISIVWYNIDVELYSTI